METTSFGTPIGSARMAGVTSAVLPDPPRPITPTREVDVGNLRVTCRVNGELRQDSSTARLIFDIPALIETISRSVTLQPGDVIATGTPEGVGIGFDPPRFLQDGDVVEVEITGLGTMRNTVRRAQVQHDAPAREAASAK